MICLLRKSTPRPLKPFKSPSAALHWYERQIYRPIFLFNMLFILIIFGVWLFLLFDYYRHQVESVLLLLVLIPFMNGVIFASIHFRQNRSGAYTFMMTRPVHSTSFSCIRIRTSVLHCLFLAVQMGMIASLIAVIEDGSFYGEALSLSNVSVILFVGFACWLSYWWSSRKNLFYLAVGSISLGTCMFVNFALFPNVYGDPYLDYWMAAMAFLVCAGMVHSYYVAWRKRLVNEEFLVIAFILWLVFGSSPFLVYNQLLPPYRYYEMLFCGLTLSAFVFEPLASTPLAWHRKRSGGGKPLPLISFPLSHQRISHYRLAIGLFFVMLFIGGLLFRGYAAFRLHQELAALQDNPYLRQENLKVIYPDVPPKNNAAIKYQTACYRIRNIYQQHPPEGYESPSNHLHWIFKENNDELLDDDYRKKLRAEVQLYNDVFEPLEQAASLAQSQFQENIEQKEPFIYLGLLHHAHNLLLAKVILAIDDEEIDEAIKNLHITSALFRATRHEPGFTINAYSKNISNDICSAIRFMLSHMLLTDQQLENLQTILEESNFSSGVLTAFCVEFHWQWTEYNKEILTEFPLSEASKDSTPVKLGSWYRWSGMHDLERAAFLKRMNWLSQKISWDYPQTFDDYPLTDENRMALNKRVWWIRIENDLERYAYFGRLSEAYAFAQQRMTCAALAIERFRLEYGRLPDSLLELDERYVCCPLQDPFGKHGSEEELQPCPKEKAFLAAMRPLLKYKRCGDGYFLYTVGTNRIDDKGKSFLRFNEKDNTFDDYRFSVHCPEVEVHEMGEQYFNRSRELRSFGAF